ncbi:hypothetical protein [Leptothrix ochracea]|uniref:hypothetical protein n=1 Tax=Leptothrix ochracea TaxID=735331 RepID=UPI0034E1EE00
MKIQVCLLVMLVTYTPCSAGTTAPVDAPEIQSVAVGEVWRKSEHRNNVGNFLPPWKEISITNIFGFKQKPMIGTKVTVIPLAEGVHPLELRIVKTNLKSGCTERGPKWWSVELEPITREEFFTVPPNRNRGNEFPFSVAIIYPSVTSAQLQAKSQLSRENLPKGISLNTVTAAITLMNSENPDVVITEYCCAEPNKSEEACDYTCSKTFIKVDRTWKLVDSSTPC